jgi:hypothetical protein
LLLAIIAVPNVADLEQHVVADRVRRHERVEVGVSAIRHVGDALDHLDPLSVVGAGCRLAEQFMPLGTQLRVGLADRRYDVPQDLFRE